jgi:hypothetical protein
MMKRHTDGQESTRFRSNRIHCINSQWYFLTREGINMGPFASKNEVERQLDLFLSAFKAPTWKNIQ